MNNSIMCSNSISFREIFPLYFVARHSKWEIKKGKDKFHPRTGHEDPDAEYKYSSTLSLTSSLDVVGWLMPRPSRFTPRKDTRYPSHRSLGEPQGQSGRVRKISLVPGFDLGIPTELSRSRNDKQNQIYVKRLMLNFKKKHFDIN